MKTDEPSVSAIKEGRSSNNLVVTAKKEGAEFNTEVASAIEELIECNNRGGLSY